MRKHIRYNLWSIVSWPCLISLSFSDVDYLSKIDTIRYTYRIALNVQSYFSHSFSKKRDKSVR